MNFYLCESWLVCAIGDNGHRFNGDYFKVRERIRESSSESDRFFFGAIWRAGDRPTEVSRDEWLGEPFLRYVFPVPGPKRRYLGGL